MFKLYAKGGSSASTAKKAGNKEGTVAKVANRVRSAVTGVARRVFSGNRTGRV